MPTDREVFKFEFIISTKPELLVVGFGLDQATALAESVNRLGVLVRHAHSGREAINVVAKFKPTVVLMGSFTPDFKTIDLIRRISNQNTCGIILLSDNVSYDSCLHGLEAGADHFMSIASTHREICAWIRAIQRRFAKKVRSYSLRKPHFITVGPISISVDRRMVRTLEGHYLRLTLTEFDLIELLLSAKEKVVTREKLCQHIFSETMMEKNCRLNQVVSSLRSKLPRTSNGEWLIQNVRKIGYIMRQ